MLKAVFGPLEEEEGNSKSMMTVKGEEAQEAKAIAKAKASLKSKKKTIKASLYYLIFVKKVSTTEFNFISFCAFEETI